MDLDNVTAWFSLVCAGVVPGSSAALVYANENQLLWCLNTVWRGLKRSEGLVWFEAA